MIRVTRLNGDPFVINADMIVEMEATPDTIIGLSTRQKVVVRESVDDVIAAVVEYKRRIMKPVFEGEDESD